MLSNPGGRLFFFLYCAAFHLLVILIITVISIVGLISESPADIDLIDNTSQYLALGVQDALFKMTDGITGGFAHAADQDHPSYMAGNHQRVGKSQIGGPVDNHAIKTPGQGLYQQGKTG